MQKTLLFCCCFWIATLSAQNNWNPFPLNQLAYFNKGANNPVDMYWADSAITNSLGQTVHIIDQKYHSNLGHCSDTVYSQIIVPTASGQSMYITLPQPDSFIIDNGFLYYQRGGILDSFPYLANVGETWTQQIMQPEADFVFWSCDSIVWANHLGFDDSIKYFTAQPQKNGINLAPQQFKLAKNLGLISFIPFSYNWDSLNVPIWENIGFIHNTDGHFGFTSSRNNWERKVCSTNDVFTYYQNQTYGGYRRIHIVDSITYFYENSDSIIYCVQTDRYTAYNGVFSTTTSFDTVKIDKHFPQPFHQYPNKSLNYGASVVSPSWVYLSYNEFSQNTNTRELYANDCMGGIGWEYYDTTLCGLMNSLSFSDIFKARYQENLGGVWGEFGMVASPSSGFLYNSQLIGYRTCGDTMGLTDRDSLMNMAMRWTSVEEVTNAASFRLYPNPSQNVVQIEINPLSANYPHTVEIYDLSGKLLIIKELGIANLHQLEIHNLTQGLYIVRLLNAKNTEQSLLIKQ